MKQIFFITICFFLSLFISGQERSKADLSITSVILVDASSFKPATFVVPKNNAEIARDNSRTAVPTPEEQKEEPTILKSSVTVQNGNESTAHETTLIAVVPDYVLAEVDPRIGTIHKFHRNTPFAGYLQFNLGNMAPGQSITVHFHFMKAPFPGPVSPYRNTLSAFVFSKSSDPNPLNNYKSGSY